MKALTVKQPWASLIVAGMKDVENRTWSAPSTLPQWYRCRLCGKRRPPGWIAANAFCPGSMTSPFCFGPADGPFPFRLAIHAGKRRDIDAWLALAEDEKDAVFGKGGLLPDLPCGVLLGTVLVTGCHHADACFSCRDSDVLAPLGQGEPPTHCSPWAEPDVYHWTLADPVELAEPIPMRGRQGLWTVPDDALAAVQP